MANVFPQLVAEIDFAGNPTATYYDTILNGTSVVSYWRLNSSSTLLDELDLNDGVLTGSPSTTTGALPNDSDLATTFDGSTDDGYVVDSPSLNPTQFTIEGSLKVASLPGSTKDLVSKRGMFRLQLTSAGIVQFTVKNDTTVTTVSSGTAISTGTYYHVAGTYDGATAAIYINGVQDATAAHSVGVENTQNPLRFASVPATSVPVFQSAQTATGTSNAATVTAPASIAAGDILLAQLALSYAASPPVVNTVPTGWVLIGQDGYGAGTTSKIYMKVATGSEPGSYVWNLDNSVLWLLSAMRITNCDPVNALANPCYVALSANVTSMPTGTHLPNVDNNMVVAFFMKNGGSGMSFTEDSGTERYDLNSGVRTIAACTQTQATATSLNVTATSANIGTNGSQFFVVLAGAGLNRTACTLDDFSFHSTAIDEDTVKGHYQARLSGVGAWSDVSADCRGVSVKYGRNYELNKMDAGSASTALKNQTRNYDPANTLGVYYPNVKPNRKMRFRALLNGVYYPLFQGFIERFPSSWEQPTYDEVALTVSDGFKFLNLAGVSATLDSGLSGAVINEVLNRALWPRDSRAVDDGLFSMAADTATTTPKALAVLQDVSDSELGVFFIDHAAAGSPATFHDKEHRGTSTRSMVSQATFSDTGSGIYYQGIVPSDDDSNLVNEWTVTTADGDSRSAVDVVSRSENGPVTQDRSTRLDNPSDAQIQATSLLQQTSHTALRFDSLTLRLARGTALATWQTALSLAISDRVTVVKNPVPAAGGSVITRACYIEGIQWTITPDYWQVSYQLSPVATAGYMDTVGLDEPVSYWRFDTTT